MNFMDSLSLVQTFVTIIEYTYLVNKEPQPFYIFHTQPVRYPLSYRLPPFYGVNPFFLLLRSSVSLMILL